MEDRTSLDRSRSSLSVPVLKSTSYFVQEHILLDVFVTDPVKIDFPVFQLWLEGWDTKAAATKRRALSSGAPFDYQGDWEEIITRDTYDQFRNFKMIEPCLRDPVMLDQPLFHIDPISYLQALHHYYRLNETVVRELAGKRMKTKLRHRLDDIARRIDVPLVVAERQFDNMRRMYKFIKKCKKDHPPGVAQVLKAPISDLLQSRFWLNKELADQHARFIFLSFAQIETDDKRLRFLNVQDFEYFASVLMVKWASERQFLEVDPKFKEELHECATFALNDKDVLRKYRETTIGKLKVSGTVTDRQLTIVQGRFNLMVKGLFKIASGLYKPKEFEDLFEDIEEKLAEPWFKAQLSADLVETLLVNMALAADHLVTMPDFARFPLRPRFVAVWSRFLEGVRYCLRHMVACKETEAAEHPVVFLRPRSMSFSMAHPPHIISYAHHGFHASHATPAPLPLPTPLQQPPAHPTAVQASASQPQLAVHGVPHAPLAHSPSAPATSKRPSRTKTFSATTGGTDLKQ